MARDGVLALAKPREVVRIDVKDAPSTQIRLITPELAKMYLEAQAKNRKWRRELVDRYKAEMLAGRWQLNGQPIIFDESNRMIDGQHRMMAVAEANMPIEMMVVSGVRSGLEATIDMGKARTLGDVFQMKGVRNAKLLSRTSKLLLIWNTRFNELVKKQMFTQQLLNVHPQEIYDYYREHQMEIDRACADFKKHSPIITNTGAAVLAFVFAVLEKISLEKCYVFMNSYVGGHIKNDWSYMAKVRDDIMARVPNSKIRLMEGERISILFGVWNVIYNKKSIQEVEETKLNIPMELLKNGPD
jgi:hypothetical protein